jgi:hypothetical protein
MCAPPHRLYADVTRDGSSGRGGGTAVDRLVAALFDVGDLAPATALAPEVRGWLEASSRFRVFAETNRDKIRKKLRSAADADASRDVRAELLASYLLVADRRFEVAFEAYGAGRRGPDLTTAFRTNQRFNLEVTRVRAAAGTAEAVNPAHLIAADEASSASPSAPGPAGHRATTGAGRLPYTLLGKLRQLPSGTPNVVLMMGDGGPIGENEVEAAALLLKARADRRDNSFFARRGFESARDYYAHWLRLSGVFSRSEVKGRVSAAFWANRESRHPLPRDAVTAVLRCLAGT